MEIKNLFRNTYSLEEINIIECQLCNDKMIYNAWKTWCASRCYKCLVTYHFRKEITGYRLTDIMWETKIGGRFSERRFWQGSQNNIYFRTNYPRLEFEIENFDKETLLRLNLYIKNYKI